MLGLTAVTQGTILFDGEDITRAGGVTAVFCTQVVTWGKHRTPIRRQLRDLVYQAMT